MKRFFMMAGCILISFGLVEYFQWWREASFEKWLDRSYFAIAGVGIALLNVWAAP